MQNKNIITNEIAIRNIGDDLLNYRPFAEKVQKIIQGYANNEEPLTIGIYGKWGSGKSSLLNLIERFIEIFPKEDGVKGYVKLHYNPWIYQTKEEMLFDFFDMLSRSLTYGQTDKLKEAGRFIKKYSNYLKAVKLSASVGIPKVFNAGVSFEPHEILKRLGEDLEGEEKNLHELKKDINTALKQSDKKIVIFIDDVDRLDKDEIFTLFKLIKIIADFKNLIFVVCLDPDYVAKAIHKRYGEEVNSGKEYLEKIINIPLELPLVEHSDTEIFLKEKLKPILLSKKIRDKDLEELFQSIRVELFSSPREIIRIINSFAISYYAIGDEVNTHDLFWIEYLKIKHPNAYQKIKKYASTFKTGMLFINSISFNDFIQNQSSESGLRKTLAEGYPDAYKVVDFLFPIDRTGTISAYQTPKVKAVHILDAELRINHINHFEKYFSFHINGKLSELSFSKFREAVIEDNPEEAITCLSELIERSGERKITYRLTSEIEVMPIESTTRYFLFLIHHLEYFKETSDLRSHSIEIVQSIAKKLVIDHKTNKKLIIKISQELDYIHLSWFAGVLIFDGSEVPYIKDIKELLVSKIIDSELHPFFHNRSIARVVMEIWSEIQPESFKNYIYNQIHTEANAFSFITSFPYLWNSTINGVFKEEDFKYLSDDLDLDSDIIYDKLKSSVPELAHIQNITDISVEWRERDNNTAITNIKQFFHWYFNKKNQDEIDNKQIAGPTPSV